MHRERGHSEKVRERERDRQIAERQWERVERVNHGYEFI